MSTSRKDYVAIAAAIKTQRSHHDYFLERALDALSDVLANHFAADNPAFDRARFLKAAGVQS